MFKPFRLIRAVFVAVVFALTAACAANRSARVLDIIRDQPLICDYIPWWPGCPSEGGGSGGGSGANNLPD